MGAGPSWPWSLAPPATTGTSLPSVPSAYLRCQKSSTEWTRGTSSKFQCGGGELVAHSSVLASHGSASANSGLRKLLATLNRNTMIEVAMRNAPMVEAKFQKFHPPY